MLSMSQLGTGSGNFGNFGAFTIKSGRAVPSDLATLGDFKALQRAINVGLRAKGLPTIAVDGELGSRTLAAVNSLGIRVDTVQTLANTARPLAISIATTFGATPDFTPDPAAPPPRTDIAPPPAFQPPGKSNTGKIVLIGALALLGIGAIFVIAKSGKRKKTTAASH
jgi:hypothetical protein